MERVLRLLDRGRERRLVGGLRLVRQALEVACHVREGHVLAHGGEREQLRLFDQPRLDLRREQRHPDVHVLAVRGATHHRPERAGLGVVREQRFRHLRLHAQHVDHEAERREIPGKAVEDASASDRRRIGGCRDEPVEPVSARPLGARYPRTATSRVHDRRGSERAP